MEPISKGWTVALNRELVGWPAGARGVTLSDEIDKGVLVVMLGTRPEGTFLGTDPDRVILAHGDELDVVDKAGTVNGHELFGALLDARPR